MERFGLRNPNYTSFGWSGGDFFGLWGEATFWERFESGSQAFDTLDSLSAGGGAGVGATRGLQDPKGRTTGGEDRDPTRLMTPAGVGGLCGIVSWGA